MFVLTVGLRGAIQADHGSLVWQQPNASAAAIASNGRGFLVAWANTGSDELQASLLDLDGAVRTTLTLAVERPAVGPRLAVSGSNYLVGWMSNDMFTWRVVHEDGTFGLSETIPQSVFPTMPRKGLCAVAGNNTGFMVTWMDLVEGRTPTLMGGKLNSEGSSGFNFFLVSSSVDSNTLAMGSSPNHFFTVWNQLGEVNSNAVDSLSGTVGAWYASRHFVVSRTSQARQPVVTWNGASFAVVWQDTQSDSSQPVLRSALIRRGGNVVATDIELKTSADVAHPSVSRTGPWMLVTWTERGTSGDRQFVGQLFDSHFRPLSPRRVVWSDVGTTGYGTVINRRGRAFVAALQLNNGEDTTAAALRFKSSAFIE